MVEAEKILKQFHPSDGRLVLGIFLGCRLVEHLRVSSKVQKQMAERICNGLAERVSHYRQQLLDEMKTELLEVQKGEIQSLRVSGPSKSA